MPHHFDCRADRHNVTGVWPVQVWVWHLRCDSQRIYNPFLVMQICAT
jgi:hypothetical protein